MKRSVQLTFVCAVTIALSLAAGCGSPAPKQNKPVKMVVFITNSTSDFWKIARKGTEKADAELSDVAVSFETTNTGAVDEQNGLIRHALDAEEADAIAVSPVDPTAQKTVINNAAKRALVVTQDSDAPDTDRALYIGADNRAAGHQAGDLIKKALPQGGKIMVFVGKREVQNAKDRFEGLKEALQGSNIVVLDLMTDDADAGNARNNAYEALKKNPDIAGMVGLWSYNGPAIVQALRPEGKLGKVQIVCFDDDRDTLTAVKEGSIFATVAQQPFEYGYRAVTTVEKILKGDRSVIPANKIIFIPTVVIQKNNVDEYSKKLDQLLGK